MKVEKKQDSNQIELIVKVGKSDVQSILEQTAAAINRQNPLPGFRPGKAPYKLIVNKYREDYIVREALDEIVQETLRQAIAQENLGFYGNFDFNLISLLTPEWLLEYKATAVPMPEVVLGDWQSKKIKRQPILVPNEDLEKALDELAGMRKSEIKIDREAGIKDKVVLDFEVLVDGKIIEGGSAKDFELVLGENRMIPGFEDKIVGHKAGESFEFNLKFPEDYQAQELGGKEALFKIKISEVDEITLPKIDDQFAQSLGVENVQALKDRLSENIAQEKYKEQEDRLEIETIKHLVDTAKIGEIPNKMAEDSIADLVHEFEHNLAHQGLSLEQYAATSKKTLDQIKADFRPKAIEKIKTTLVLNKLAVDEKIDVEEKEIDEELTAQRKYYAANKEILNDLQQPEYRDHLRRTLRNRKIIKFIKSKIVES